MVKDRKGQQSTTVIRRRSPEYIKEKMIEDVLEHFDFDKCQYVMKQLNWQWFGRGIPTIDELKYSARQRLESAIAGALDRKDTLPLNSYYFSSSGVLTEWDSDGDYVTDKKNENKTTERNNL